MPGGKCAFNSAWMIEDEFKSWLTGMTKDRHSAYCTLCRRAFSIASMGRSALKSHMKSRCHLENQKRVKEQGNSMQDFLHSSKANETSSETNETISDNPSVLPNAIAPSTSIEKVEKQSSLHHLSSLSKKVADAEILWALNCVESHFSATSNAGMNALFKRMFSDSEIVSLYSMSDSKYRYLTTFGIAPHFARLLMEDIKTSPAHCIMFDESLNNELQSKQLDVHLRFWDNSLLKVETRYYTSLFIGHGRASDILEHYTEATKDLDAARTWQVGMDGPNVNIAFHKKLVDQRNEDDLPNLLDLGTCGLHVVHRAFQTGAKATDWNLDKYFLKEYKLFKDSPARREDFVSYTGSTIFPSKFCKHRWLENLGVASKSLSLMGSIKEYCEQACLRKTEPQKHDGYAFVKNLATSDKFLRAKHLFWISIAQEFEPFLTLYQADRPLIPFLASDLDKLLRTLMDRFVKDDVMASSTSYLKLSGINVSSEDNLIPAKLIDVGIATKRELNNLHKEEKATQRQILEFRIQCKAFLVRSVEKMLEKCPLKYLIVRSMRCLDPCVIAESVAVSTKLFGRLLNCLIDAKRVKDTDADQLKREYQHFVTEVVHGNPQTLLKFKNYDKVKSERIDSLLASLLEKNSYRKLWELVKCLLVLSHGQASVERGFSVNKEVMQQNFKERSVTGQRIIYDHIKKCGGVMKVVIDQDLRNAARQASSNFRTEQKRQKEAEKKKEKEDANKAVNDEILAVQEKRRRIIEDSSLLKDSIEKLMDRAEKEQNLLHVTKANSYKRTVKEMELEAVQLDSTLIELHKKLKR